ncbi:MAG: hypothetical protein ACI94Y_001901 [Maribacter sp.]|jgi:hypothetical protein
MKFIEKLGSTSNSKTNTHTISTKIVIYDSKVQYLCIKLILHI